MRFSEKRMMVQRLSMLQQKSLKQSSENSIQKGHFSNDKNLDTL